MERVCFRLQVRPDRLDDYVERHRAVWPQMLRAIERSGRRNYSLFLDTDGTLVGYYEVDDDAESARRLAADPDTAEWEADAAEFFVHLGDARPDQNTPRLREVFNLGEQLGDLD